MASAAHISMIHGTVVVRFTMHASESTAPPHATPPTYDDRTTAANEGVAKKLLRAKSCRRARKMYQGETHRLDDPKKMGKDKVLRRQLRSEKP